MNERERSWSAERPAAVEVNENERQHLPHLKKDYGTKGQNVSGNEQGEGDVVEN